MRKSLGLVLVIIAAVVSVSAQSSSQASQSSQNRKHHVEDKTAVLRVEKVVTAETAAAENFVPHTSYSYPLDDFKPGVVLVGPRTTYLKEGLRTEEVVRLLGQPASISERNEKDVVVTTYQFQRGEGRTLIAEFEHGLLVRSRTETHDAGVAADR